MSRSPLPALKAISECIAGILAATEGTSFDDYSNDWLLRRGVERGIEIIS